MVLFSAYGAMKKAREFEKLGAHKILEMKLIEPAETERAAPVVFVPKKVGSFTFLVEHRKLNAVTERIS